MPRAKKQKPNDDDPNIPDLEIPTERWELEELIFWAKLGHKSIHYLKQSLMFLGSRISHKQYAMFQHTAAFPIPPASFEDVAERYGLGAVWVEQRKLSGTRMSSKFIWLSCALQPSAGCAKMRTPAST